MSAEATVTTVSSLLVNKSSEVAEDQGADRNVRDDDVVVHAEMLRPEQLGRRRDGDRRDRPRACPDNGRADVQEGRPRGQKHEEGPRHRGHQRRHRR